MTRLDHALKLAAKGFYVFPCEENGKKPVIQDFPNKATRDPEQINRWFSGRNYNIGVFTGRFRDGEALIVIDVDDKNGKHGSAEILSLEMQGMELPPTVEQSTPSGGRHIIYASAKACRQGVDVLGVGLDIRSGGGYIIGPGSEIDGKRYAQINGHDTIALAPQWLPDRLGQSRVAVAQAAIKLPNIDQDRAEKRALDYLSTLPPVTEGGRNHAVFKAAAIIKDFGCDEAQTYRLLWGWNAACFPPLDEDEFKNAVASAYRYGREPQGARAPESQFEKIEKTDGEPDPGSPIAALNKAFAFIKTGCFVLQETTDEKKQFKTLHLGMAEFHGWHANKRLTIGKKSIPLSQLWMESTDRREYEAVIFAPGQDRGSRWYNLWRGFTVEPAATGEHFSVQMWREHALNNMCRGDAALCHWLIGYHAHLIQKPWEKVLVACVYSGGKGVGKNAFNERVGYLLGSHFVVADDDRYLLGNFNSHLESNLLFTLDEASWAGDKRAEGRLKGLITGTKHNIERKGKEPYTVDNLSRIAIIGNEAWLVPASQDERRFAIFNVGDGRKQDNQFFHDMRVGMEQGGYSHLLRFLMDYDITGLNFNQAPLTQGLVDQKHASLEPDKEWWLECLANNVLAGDTFDGPIPNPIPTNRFLDAFLKWAHQRQIRSRLPGKTTHYANIRKLAPCLERVKLSHHEDGDATYGYRHEGIERLRAEWEKYIGGSVDWNKWK